MTALTQLTPNSARLIEALSHIGYSIEDSLSDLIDNSLTAGSSGILLRFVHDGNHLQQIVVADDGSGMTAGELREAMRFGSKKSLDPASLGKFGLGLKLASLSYCDELTVFSRKNGRAVGMRWTVENIGSGWNCEKLTSKEAKKGLDLRFANLDLDESGTVICWSKLKNMPSHKRGIRSVIGVIERRLKLHFGLRFHRFIERGYRIMLDQQMADEPIRPYWVEIDPIDPFGYPQSGSEHYPKLYRCRDVLGGELQFEAHIWPPNSTDENYRLGKRASSHQGFFVYRKDRLIQAGGWFGVVNDEKEPHSSLARIKLDLPESLEDLFALNVQKSTVIPPIGFQDSLVESLAEDGSSWDSFRSDATTIYRGQQTEHLPPRYGLGRGFKKIHYGDGADSRKVLSLKWSEGVEAPIIEFGEDSLIFNRRLRDDYLIDAEKVFLNAFALLAVEILNDPRSKASGSRKGKLLSEELMHSLGQLLSE